MSTKEQLGGEVEVTQLRVDRVPKREKKQALVLFAKIGSWKESLIREMRYHTQLLSRLRDKGRSGKIHNPNLYRTPEGKVYEGRDEDGMKVYSRRGDTDRRIIVELPAGSVSSRESLDEDFGWEKGKPRTGFHDSYEESLEMVQISLECQEFADELLKNRSSEVWAWVRARKVERDDPVGEIRASTRKGDGIGAAWFGLFFDTFVCVGLKKRFATTKSMHALEVGLLPLKNCLAEALGIR